MNDLIKTEDFVEPYYIEELGDLGLSAADIAKSLEAEPKHIREKLKSRGFLDRIKAQGFQAVAVVTLNKNNGLEYEEYLLDVSAAKLFVIKYDSRLVMHTAPFSFDWKKGLLKTMLSFKTTPFSDQSQKPKGCEWPKLNKNGG